MENMSQYYGILAECALTVVRTLIAIVFGVIIIPWVKKYAIPWLKEKQLYGFIKQLVRAAEKLAQSGAISKDTKLDYVTSILEKRGVHVTADIRALIESAVGDLDDELAHGMQELIEVISEAEAEATIVYDEGKITVEEDEFDPEDPESEIDD